MGSIFTKNLNSFLLYCLIEESVSSTRITHRVKNFNKHYLLLQFPVKEHGMQRHPQTILIDKIYLSINDAFKIVAANDAL